MVIPLDGLLRPFPLHAMAPSHECSISLAHPPGYDTAHDLVSHHHALGTSNPQHYELTEPFFDNLAHSDIL